MENPHNIRQAMNGIDPRQRGLFTAAWSLGFIARFAAGGAEAITLGGGVGSFGIAYAKTEYEQPHFDEKGGVYPAYHAFRGLAALEGQPLVDLAVSDPCEIQAIATEQDDGIEVWVANLTSQMKCVEFATEFTGKAAILNASEFELATQDGSAMNSLEREFTNRQLTLAPYAVARLRSPRR